MKAFTTWIRQHKLALALFLLIVAGGAFAWLKRGSSRDFIELAQGVKRGTILQSVYGIGTVEATRSYTLKLAVASTIKALYVKEGDEVKRGQRLVDLEGVGTFTSPLAGTITQLPVKIGETIFPQAIVLNVVDLRDRYLTVSLEQRGALQMRPGLRARISFDSLREQSFGGKVEAVYANAGNFFVRIGVPDLPTAILPGMTADVAVVVKEHENALLAPAAAISEGKVYVKREQRQPEAVAVQTGVVDGAEVEIVGDSLREGDRLYVKGAGK